MLDSFRTWLREMKRINEAEEAKIKGEIRCWTLEWVILQTLLYGSKKKQHFSFLIYDTLEIDTLIKSILF